MTPPQLLTAALAYLDAGLSILPCSLPTKEPAYDLLRLHRKKPKWQQYMKERIIPENVSDWFAGPHDPPAAIGIIGGAISGNLEIIDIDDAALVKPWSELVRELAPDVFRSLVIERTLRGRVHVFYRCSEPVPGCQKLAVSSLEEGNKGLIETKAEGGYVCAAPSPGYKILQGRLDKLPIISAAEREILIQVCRAFTCVAPVQDAPAPRGKGAEGDRPGDEYNVAEDWRELLTENGWTRIRTCSAIEHWRRPGKDKGGISATWNYVPGAFYVFTTNAAPLEDRKAYRPFALYALLDHAGDYSAASRALRKGGYGKSHLHIPTGPPVAQSNLAPDLAGQDEAESLPDNILPMPLYPEGLPQIDDKLLIALASDGERGLGKLAKSLFGGRLVYDHAAKTWYKWQEHYWLECQRAEQIQEMEQMQAVLRLAAMRHRQKKKPVKGEDGKVKKVPKGYAYEMLTMAADSLRKIMTTRHVLEFAAAGRDGLGITGSEWDQEGWLLPCPNGVLDLQTGELAPGRPEQYMRAVCPTEYDEFARCPRWEQFIEEIMPDEEIASFLHRLLGYGITGRVSEHVFPVFWGEASRNGKGTLLETIAAVMGPMAHPLNAKSLMAQGFQAEHDAQLMDLRGRRLVWASETGDRKMLDATRIKLWTGGDTLTGRAPYAAAAVTFAATAKLILLTNFKPRAPADDRALWNRLILIPFSETFVDEPAKPSEHKRDRLLPDILRQEATGILRWLVNGCLDWQRVGLDPPSNIRTATQSYLCEEDLMGAFLVDHVIEKEGEWVRAKELYEAYRKWAENNGEKPWGNARFAQGIQRRGIRAERKADGVRYIGICWPANRNVNFPDRHRDD